MQRGSVLLNKVPRLRALFMDECLPPRKSTLIVVGLMSQFTNTRDAAKKTIFGFRIRQYTGLWRLRLPRGPGAKI